jgi:hypothetical protein
MQRTRIDRANLLSGAGTPRFPLDPRDPDILRAKHLTYVRGWATPARTSLRLGSVR